MGVQAASEIASKSAVEIIPRELRKHLQPNAALYFFFSIRRRHTILTCDWSSDVCSSDLAIAERIGRSSSTVSREVGRNGGRDGYRALAADAGAFERARRPKVSKLAGSAELAGVVAAKLDEDWSPQQ